MHRLSRYEVLVFLLAAGYFLLLSLSNVVWLRLSARRSQAGGSGRVSVLVPCRNEAGNIARCLDSLLAQSYDDYEILVLDDRSNDGTWDLIEGYAERHPERVTALQGRPLPASGWYGKPHAMHQLAERAGGSYLLFTDADTVHGPESVAWAVGRLERMKADCLSGYVRQRIASFGEMIIVPVMYIMSAFFLPLWLIPATRLPALSFAIGQFILFRREAFDAIGGYACVAERISDDVYVAREVKRAGFRLAFVDLRRQVSCRMYDGYAAAFEGIGKNIFDFFRHRPLFFAAAASVLALFVVLPLLLLPFQLASADASARPTLTAIATLLAAWALTLYDRGLPWWSPLLYPLQFVHILYMAWKGFGVVSSGRGVVWKGRVLR
jgi:chlorobactene glucosyltransferase